MDNKNSFLIVQEDSPTPDNEEKSLEEILAVGRGMPENSLPQVQNIKLQKKTYFGSSNTGENFHVRLVNGYVPSRVRVLTLTDGPSSHEVIAAKLASTGSVFFWMAAPTPPVYKYKLTKFVSYYRFSQNFKTEVIIKTICTGTFLMRKVKYLR